jgi:hypothetical protein
MDLQTPTASLDTTKLFSLINLWPTTLFDEEEYTEEKDLPEHTEPNSAEDLDSGFRVERTERLAFGRWIDSEVSREESRYYLELSVEEMESCVTQIQSLPIRFYTKKHPLIALSIASHFRNITSIRQPAFPIKGPGLTAHRKPTTLPQRK